MIKKPQWHIERSTDHTTYKVVLVLDTGEDHEINHFLDALLLKSHEQETAQLIGLLKSREKWDDKQKAITSWMQVDDLPKLLDLLLELADITDPFVVNKRDNEDAKQSSLQNLSQLYPPISDNIVEDNNINDLDVKDDEDAGLVNLMSESNASVDANIVSNDDNNPMSAPELDIVYDNDKPLSAESLTALSSNSDQVFDYQDLDTEGSENS